MDPFRAPWLFSNRHVQTIIPGVLPWRRPEYRFERWDTPDGDFIDVAWAGKERAKPLLVLFHGLEGSCESHYARRFGRYALGRGWSFAVPHFRGCSRDPSGIQRVNRTRWGYHAGDSKEIDWILKAFSAQHGGPVYAAGVSLGANALLKWLGEQGQQAAAVVARTAAISATFDLAATGAALSRGIGRVYGGYFLADDLRAKAVVRLGRYGALYDEHCIYAAATLRDFDEAVTAPLYGFRDVRDYYAQSSAGPLLPNIGVPTLVLNARDDPFVPEFALRAVESLRDAGRLDSSVTLDFPEQGGHAGFLGDGGWLEKRVFGFLAAESAGNT